MSAAIPINGALVMGIGFDGRNPSYVLAVHGKECNDVAISLSATRCLTAILTLLVTAPALAAVAPDAVWPSRPVRLIVPFPPGGAVDPLARLLSARLPAALGQQFVVDNRPGASGSIGMAIAAKAAPDGYTFALTFNTLATNPSLIPNLPYDTVRDFVPVMLIGTAPSAIVTHPSKPYQSFGDVIRAATAKPDTITYGSIGSGSLGQLAMTLLQQAGGFRMVHVPYKGGGPMTTEALGGQVDLAIASVQILSPHVRAGKLRAIAVTGEQRSHTLPDVPALAEQGFNGFSVLAWGAIFGPAGIPKPILDRFHGELVRLFNQPDVRSLLGDQLGMDIVASSPAALQSFLVSEIERWGTVIRAHRIRAD